MSWTSFVPTGPLWYPSLYGNVSGLTAVGATALGVMPTFPVGKGDYGCLLMARIVGAAAGVASVGATAALGGRLFGRDAGLLAAALVAVAPVEVMQAHFASADSMLTLWMTVATLSAVSLLRTASVRAAVLAGLAAGLAAAAKYPGFAALAPIGWALAEQAWRTRAWGRVLGLGLVVAAVAVSTAIVGSPVYAFRWHDVFAEMRHLRWAAQVGEAQNAVVSATLGWYGRPGLYQLAAGLPFTLGLSFYALALAGCTLAFVRRTDADRLLAVASVPYFVVITSTPATCHRYLMPLVPILAVLGARAAFAIPARRLALATAVLVVAHTAIYTTSLVARLGPSQQIEVAQWLGERRDPPPRIVMPDVLAQYSGLGRFLGGQHVSVEWAASGHWLDTTPDLVLLPEWVAVGVRRNRGLNAAASDLDRLEAPAGDYREAMHWPPSWFLHDDVLAWLDPGLRTDWFGRTGFRLYVRRAADDGRF
jgi:hypothetical protein